MHFSFCNLQFACRFYLAVFCLARISRRLPSKLPCIKLYVRVRALCYISPFHIPPQTTVAVNTTMSGLDAESFPQPEEYRPERWLRTEGEKSSVHPFASLPFGHGQRSCISRRSYDLMICYAKFRSYLPSPAAAFSWSPCTCKETFY